MNADTSGQPTVATDPANFIFKALKVIPSQTKFVLVGVVVFAGAALVLAWTRAFSPGLTVTFVVLILIVGSIASALAATPRRNLAGVGGFMSWALAILFIVLLLLMLTSTFFGTPAAGAAIMSRLLGSVEPLTRLPSTKDEIVIAAGDKKPLGALIPQIRDEPTGADLPARVQRLASYPPMEIAGTLTIAPKEKRVLAVSTLRFSGGTILTNGADLTIETNNLEADNGTIRAFENPNTPRADEGGQSAGRVTIIVHGQITGRLSVDLQGQIGADGKSGDKGSRGAKGPGGENSASHLFDCAHGPGRGGKGGTGGPGSPGQSGFGGGNGGVLIIRASDGDAARRLVGDPIVSGGKGGKPGIGGLGGDGGDGGNGGSSSGNCSGTGPYGEAGDQGPKGPNGEPGADGKPGDVIFENARTT